MRRRTTRCSMHAASSCPQCIIQKGHMAAVSSPHSLQPELNLSCRPIRRAWPSVAGGIQDLILLDRRKPELARLVDIGNAQCRPVPDLEPAPMPSLYAAHINSALREWPAQNSSAGFCALTDAAQPSDCEAGDKGVLGLLPMDTQSIQSAARACLIRCAGCARCRFVSLSLRFGDCSWYHVCNLDALDRSVKHFISGPALALS